MAIFNSYVKLPEGNAVSLTLNTTQKLQVLDLFISRFGTAEPLD